MSHLGDSTRVSGCPCLWCDGNGPLSSSFPRHILHILHINLTFHMSIPIFFAATDGSRFGRAHCLQELGGSFLPRGPIRPHTAGNTRESCAHRSFVRMYLRAAPCTVDFLQKPLAGNWTNQARVAELCFADIDRLLCMCAMAKAILWLLCNSSNKHGRGVLRLFSCSHERIFIGDVSAEDVDDFLQLQRGAIFHTGGGTGWHECPDACPGSL